MAGMVLLVGRAFADEAAPDMSPDAEQRLARDAAVARERSRRQATKDGLLPDSTQVAVYVSLDVGDFFALDGVELSVDEARVAKYVYSDGEVAALKRGGLHRLWIGDVQAGEHELVAVFTGRGAQGEHYRRATNLSFEKGSGPQQLELSISDSDALQQPELQVRNWERR